MASIEIYGPFKPEDGKQSNLFPDNKLSSQHDMSTFVMDGYYYVVLAVRGS